jgi:xylulokinase
VIRKVVEQLGRDTSRIAALAACGQMHGTVLIEESGELARDTAPLWNDKRTAGHVTAFEAANPPASYLAETGNIATPAWPAFKLQWIRDNDPEAYHRAAAVLMPKDYVNFMLTGEIATDWTEASLSFLMHPQLRSWSHVMAGRLGVEIAKMPPIRAPGAMLGPITAEAARLTGLPAGLPVLVGGGDFPLALLGSGLCRPGLGADLTGTSCIITLVANRPLLDPEISNVATPDGHWGAFALLDSGGDAMRWARRAFHDNEVSYERIVTRAAEAPAGSDGLFFLPYLSGERLGEHRNARAQFFGLSARHGLAHLHRAVMEGVAFAMTRHIRSMERASGMRLDRVVASGGGAKTQLWLQIKASVYDRPVVVPEEAECSVIGCAILAACATGRFSTPAEGADAFVRYEPEISPKPGWVERYSRMQPIFARLYSGAQDYYDDLDALNA